MKKQIRKSLILLFITMFLISSCSNSSKDLLIGKWNLLSITKPDGVILYPEENSSYYISFSENNKLGGKDGCNHISGTFDTSFFSDELNLKQLITTEMGCIPSPTISRDFTEALGKINKFDLADNKLTLSEENSDYSIFFEKEEI